MKRVNVKLLIVSIVVCCIVATGWVEADDFDLTGVGIDTGVGSPETHGIGIHGSILSMDIPERVLVRNPSHDIVADSDISYWVWDAAHSSFQLFSGHLDTSVLFPGIYEIEVMYSGGASDLRRIDVPEHLFCSAIPTGFRILDWWLPGGGDIPQPTFAWDPFQSPEFDAAREYLTYMVEVGIYTPLSEIICWRGVLSGDVIQVDYNFDGLAVPDYETLPPGSYSAFLFANESQDYPSFSLDVGDEYGTWRCALEGISLTVVGTIVVDIDIKPETLNLKSKGVFTAFIELPEGYGQEDVDMGTVECEGAPAVKAVMADDNRLIVKFNTEDLVGVSAGNAVELIVTGQLLDGTAFVGSDTIRVIDKGGKTK